MISYLWSAVFTLMAVVGQSQSSDIVVTVSTDGETKGSIHLALFKDAASFPENTKAYKGIRLAADSKTVQHTFSTVPYGTYALAVYHDLNGNNVLDRNFLGIPSEPYAFSNNPTVKWDEPTFSEALFEHGQAPSSIRIQVKKWSAY